MSRETGSSSAFRTAVEWLTGLLSWVEFEISSPLSTSQIRERLSHSVDTRVDPLYRHMKPGARGTQWVAGSLVRDRVTLWLEHAYLGRWVVLDARLLPGGKGTVLSGRIRFTRVESLVLVVLLAPFIGILVFGTLSAVRGTGPAPDVTSVLLVILLFAGLVFGARRIGRPDARLLLAFVADQLLADPSTVPRL